MAVKEEEQLVKVEEEDQDGEHAQADTIDALLDEHEEYEDDGDPFGIVYGDDQENGAEDAQQDELGVELGGAAQQDSELATQDSGAGQGQAASSGSRGRPMPAAYYMHVSDMEQPEAIAGSSHSQQDAAGMHGRGHFSGPAMGPAVDRQRLAGAGMQQQHNKYPGRGGQRGGGRWDAGRGRGRHWFPHDGPRHPGPGGPGMMPPIAMPHMMMPGVPPHGMHPGPGSGPPPRPPPSHPPPPPPRPPPFPPPGPVGAPRHPASGTPPLAPQPGVAAPGCVDSNGMLGMPSILRPAGAPIPAAGPSTGGPAPIPAPGSQSIGIDQQQPGLPHIMMPNTAGAWRPRGPAAPAEGPVQAWHASGGPPPLDTAHTHIREYSPSPDAQAGDMLPPTPSGLLPDELPWPAGPGVLPGAPGFMGPMLPGVPLPLKSNKWVRPGAVPSASAGAPDTAKEAKDAELQSRLALIEQRKREQAARRAAAATTATDGSEQASAGPSAPAPAAVSPEAADQQQEHPGNNAVAALLQAQEEYIAKLRRAIELQEAAAKQQGRKPPAGANGSSSTGAKRTQHEQASENSRQGQATGTSPPVAKRVRRVVKPPPDVQPPVGSEQQDANQFCEELDTDDAAQGQGLPEADGNGTHEFELDFDEVLLGTTGQDQEVDEEMDVLEEQPQQVQLEQQSQLESSSHRQQGAGKQHRSERQGDRHRERSSERQHDHHSERHTERHSHRHHHHQRRSR